MEWVTSSGTIFSAISQEKKLSPASPAQSVPSQSKAANRGFKRSTESTKSLPVFLTGVAALVFSEDDFRAEMRFDFFLDFLGASFLLTSHPLPVVCRRKTSMHCNLWPIRVCGSR